MDDLSDKILRQKAIAIGNDKIFNAYRLIISLLLLATVYLLFTYPAFAIITAVALIAQIIIGVVVDKKSNVAKCPKCGHNWEIPFEDPELQIMDPSTTEESIITWNNCPGCGLEISEENHDDNKP